MYIVHRYYVQGIVALLVRSTSTLYDVHSTMYIVPRTCTMYYVQGTRQSYKVRCTQYKVRCTYVHVHSSPTMYLLARASRLLQYSSSTMQTSYPCTMYIYSSATSSSYLVLCTYVHSTGTMYYVHRTMYDHGTMFYVRIREHRIVLPCTMYDVHHTSTSYSYKYDVQGIVRYLLYNALCTMHYALCTMHYVQLYIVPGIWHKLLPVCLVCMYIVHRIPVVVRQVVRCIHIAIAHRTIIYMYEYTVRCTMYDVLYVHSTMHRCTCHSQHAATQPSPRARREVSIHPVASGSEHAIVFLQYSPP